MRSTRRTCRAGRSQGFSTKWFGPAIHNADMQQALWLSLKAATLATLIALVLGSAASFGVHRFRFFGREAVSFLLVLPIALPGIITGMALNSYFTYWHFNFGLWTIVIGARDVLRRRRLQQRDRAAAARARLADRGVDGSRRGRLPDLPLRHVPVDLDGADLRRPARVRALVRRGDRDHVHRRREQHAADVDLQRDPASARSSRR